MTERVRFFLHIKETGCRKGNEICEAYENHEVLKATVTQILGGGICTTVDEVEYLSRQTLFPILAEDKQVWTESNS